MGSEVRLTLLAQLQTDYINLGMIHFINLESDWDTAMVNKCYDLVSMIRMCPPRPASTMRRRNTTLMSALAAKAARATVPSR